MSSEPDGVALRLGANWNPAGSCRFLVWAPKAERVEVHVVHPGDRLLATEPIGGGYHALTADEVGPGTRYFYRLDGRAERPDPASRFQPDGVHGPSQVVDQRFAWTDQCWVGLPLADYILYELHVGTFTEEGTFDAAIGRLDELVDLGVTAIEIMPVAQFPGARNWGYDGVYLFAVQASYGGPEGLKRLVDACHQRGLAVCLDAVYNHLGPEGNYLAEFGHYFTGRYRTPWGDALNFDGRWSDDVRRYFCENIAFWVREFHIDMLRLDAVHAIFDNSARQFLGEVADAAHLEGARLGRRVYVAAETTKNDTRYVLPAELGGYGHDALWNFDFHYAIHALLTGERNGRYADFGRLADVAKAYREGFVLTGQYSHDRGRRHGVSSLAIPASQFVVYNQNHDQVGNRLASERQATLVSFDELKLAAGLLLLSPYLPLLFMGEEYGETAPFPYFVSHCDSALCRAVREGRQREFAAYNWRGQIPDPAAEATFRLAKLDRGLRREPRHRELWDLYRELIRLRKTIPALARLNKEQMEVGTDETHDSLYCRRWHEGSEVCAIFHFGRQPAAVTVPLPQGGWRVAIRSSGSGGDRVIESDGRIEWNMPARAFCLLERTATSS